MTEQSSGLRVLIAGLNYSTNLCLARSYGEAGYDVEVLRVFWTKKPFREFLKPEAYSCYVKAYHTVIVNEDERRLVEKLLELADPGIKTLLISADDLVIPVTDKNYELLKQYYVIPNVEGKQDGIRHLMRKDLQKQIAISVGLPVPRGCVICADHGRFEIPKEVKYPCFVKPVISVNRAKSLSRKCGSEKELKYFLEKISNDTAINMLVEESIDIRHEYSLLGISTRNGVIGPGFLMIERGGHEERQGVAMTGRIIPCNNKENLIQQLLQLMTELKFEGLFDIDLIEAVDGTFYFTEVNFRYGASGRALNKCGLNLPGMFADYMLKGVPIDMTCSLKQTGKRFLSNRILMDEYIKGYLSRKEMRCIQKSADFTFFEDPVDRKPNQHYGLFCAAAPVLRIYYAKKEKKKRNSK